MIFPHPSIHNGKFSWSGFKGTAVKPRFCAGSKNLEAVSVMPGVRVYGKSLIVDISSVFVNKLAKLVRLFGCFAEVITPGAIPR